MVQEVKMIFQLALPAWSLLSTNDEGTFMMKILENRPERNQHQTEKLTPSGYTKPYSVP